MPFGVRKEPRGEDGGGSIKAIRKVCQYGDPAIGVSEQVEGVSKEAKIS